MQTPLASFSFRPPRSGYFPPLYVFQINILFLLIFRIHKHSKCCFKITSRSIFEGSQVRTPKCITRIFYVAYVVQGKEENVYRLGLLGGVYNKDSFLLVIYCLVFPSINRIGFYF